MIGIGIQLAIITITTVLFVAITYLIEYNSDTLLETLLVLYIITGLIAGTKYSD